MVSVLIDVSDHQRAMQRRLNGNIVCGRGELPVTRMVTNESHQFTNNTPNQLPHCSHVA